ncbi:MAG: hypothetical protein N2170_09060 [Bacteroidia bacterium]|nr:hypothetical protein [Bacteroidia bacterium]
MAKLWLFLGLSWGQSFLPLTRIVYQADGRVYWVREALLPFTQKTFTVKIPGPAKPLTLLPQPDYRVKRWTISADTLIVLSGEPPLSDLVGFLRQHIGATAWISYLASSEWEESQGIVEHVSPDGSVLLRKMTQERVWIPGKLIQAVRTDGSSLRRESRPAWRLTLEIDTVLPTGRVAVAGWDSLSPWKARHIVQIIGPTRLRLLTSIQLPPFSENTFPVEIYLTQGINDSAASTLWHLPLQKVTSSGELWLPLLHAELPYTDIYRASLPDLVENLDPLVIGQWKGWAEHSLQIVNTEKIPLPAGQVQLLDEQGLPLAQSSFPLTAPTATGYIPLTRTPALQIRLQETEVRREKPKDPLAGPKVILSGTLRIHNGENREIRLLIEKPLTGQPLQDRLGFARATPLQERRGNNTRYLLHWELLLRPGATEILEYGYEIVLPGSK